MTQKTVASPSHSHVKFIVLYLTLLLARWRYVNVCGLIDVGSAWPGIEGRNQGGELPLQHVVIVPVFPLAAKNKKRF